MPLETLNEVPVEFPMNNRAVSLLDTRVASSSDADPEKAYKNLLWACRIGDTDLADSITLLPQLDINKVDEWDYLPLILASLCGHLPIVEMLLARGAICERDTFQGARCIYGALTDDIRNTLLSYNITKKTDTDQPFLAHISSLLSPLMVSYACKDIAFVFPHERDRELQVLVVNRFLLAARSSYFRERVLPGGIWCSLSKITMPAEIDATIFKAVIDYLYLRTDFLPLEKPPMQLLQYALDFNLDHLLTAILYEDELKPKAVKSRQDAELQFVKDARLDMEGFLESHIFPNVLVKSLDDIDLKELKYGSDQDDEEEEEVGFEELDVSRMLSYEERKLLMESSALPDAILCSVDLESNTVVFYPVHRAMLVRANLYQTMVDPNWSTEAAEIPFVDFQGDYSAPKTVDRPLMEPHHVPVIRTYMGATRRKVPEVILRFLYYNDSVVVEPEIAVEVLLASDELNIERLKSISVLSLTNFVGSFALEKIGELPSKVGYDVFELIEISWRLQAERLEQHMTKLIAHNIEAVFEDKKLRSKLLQLIKASAHRIQERQSTDTIELVDDMRYYLAKKYAVYDEFTNLEGIGATLNPNMAEPEDNRTFKAALLDYEYDVMIVDKLLDELGLDA